MSQPNLIIAEDDTVLREIYMKKFTLAGFNIRTAENGEQAIAEVEKEKPDLMILDLNMPVIDGFGVLQKFPRAERAFPIIILSNFGDTRNRERGMELGADDFFVKSEMTIKTLLQKVTTLLQAKQMWKQ